MPLDPVLAQLIAGMTGDETADQPVTPDVTAARANIEGTAAILTPVEQRDPVADVRDTTVPGPADPIPVRVYRPLSAVGRAPVIVWFHGGGWMIGSLDTGDTVARALCHGVGAVVVSVDYRLAPEYPWPAGLEDAAAVLRWVADHADEQGGDPEGIAVGGDSAGGNMAAVLAQQVRGTGPALAGQILLYPATDLDIERSDRYPSLRENASGYILTLESMHWSVETYLPPGADVSDPRISPVRNPDLAGLPPAVVAVAEFDPLRDQGTVYAAQLQQAGVATVVHDGRGLIHGVFDMLGTVPAARSEFDRIVASVRELLLHDSERLVTPGEAGRS
jgi:acetyl esterase